MKRMWYQNRNILVRPQKNYLIATLIVVFLLILFFFYWRPSVINQKPNFQNADKLFREPHNKDKPHFRHRIVHLDLKGAPPKISYYKTLFPLLSKMGATGVLMEYEDMFPYDTPLIKNVSALNAYSLKDIDLINMLAEQNHLEIIPLLQTFGHLEFLLKLDVYKEYREIPEYPQVICPTHANTLRILFEMIDQVVRSHPRAKFIHIGADEVYYLGVCDRCTNTMSQRSLTKNMLFLDHIKNLIELISRKYPHLRVLMWDDEFRSFSVSELNQGAVSKMIEPVVWKYSKDVYDELGPSLWYMYSSVFPRVWIASAFKGATGSNQFVSDVTHYVQNHRSWLSLVAEYQPRMQFEGIIITGWQRYDHFAVLCELLPVSLPSLAMSLRLVQGHDDSPLSPPTEIAQLLGCAQPYALIGPVFGSPKCSFVGGDILENVLRLQQLKQEYETMLDDSRVKGWLSDYNVANSFSNPQLVESVTVPLGRIREELSQVDGDMTIAMHEVYDNYTIREWKDTYLRPFERTVNEMWVAKERILAKDSWPRRPLSSADDDGNRDL